MNHHLLRSTWVTALGVLLLASANAHAQYTPGAGLAGTPHDFTVENGAGNVTNIGLCTFCHTPHKGIESRLLWNHTLSGNTFDWSDVTTTQGGSVLSGFDSSWQGISKNCLSCHDGSVAIGDVAWYKKQSWTGAGNEILDHQHSAATDPARIADPADGDLLGNHPVAHPFPLGGATNTYNGASSGTLAAASGWQTDPESLGIRLYNDIGGAVSAGSVPGSTGIECGSCHDPHNGNGIPETYFLRGSLEGNDTTYLCLKCHDK